jgi:hypothetical protein
MRKKIILKAPKTVLQCISSKNLLYTILELNFHPDEHTGKNSSAVYLFGIDPTNQAATSQESAGYKANLLRQWDNAHVSSIFRCIVPLCASKLRKSALVLPLGSLQLGKVASIATGLSNNQYRGL